MPIYNARETMLSLVSLEIEQVSLGMYAFIVVIWLHAIVYSH